jgi:uncharacterized protein (TIGR03435 family)
MSTHPEQKLSTTGFAAFAAILVCLASAASASESFQSVTIKTSTTMGRPFTTSSPPTLSLHGYTLRDLIEQAYMVRNFQISGGPAWLDTEHYDVAAAAGSAALPKDWIPMLRALLQDRFKLSIRRETSEVPVYALTVSKSGLKLSRSKPGACTPFDWRANRNWDILRPAGIQGHNYCGMVKSGENAELNHTIDAIGISINGLRGDAEAGLTGVLSNELDRPVIDKTGLTGRFDLHFEWNRHPIPGATAGPSIFAAVQDQLGLQLESQRGPAETLFIDHVEKPVVR